MPKYVHRYLGSGTARANSARGLAAALAAGLEQTAESAVWRYFRFTLSYCGVADLRAACRIVISYETIRQWCRKFGQLYANQVQCRRPQYNDPNGSYSETA